MGGKPKPSSGSSGGRAWSLRWEGAQAGLLDPHPLRSTQDQEWGVGTSSGEDRGLPWPQSATGAQSAPNPGDVKLAAGKKKLLPSILPAVGPVASLLGTPSAGALSGPWGASWLPHPLAGKRHLRPHVRLGRVGRGLMGVWPESTGPEPPARALDPQVLPARHP